MADAESIEFKQIDSPQHGAEAIRLAHRKSELVLAASWTFDDPNPGPRTNFSVLLVSKPAAGWHSLLDAPLVLAVSPRWDLAPNALQQLEFAYEKAGGAINDLALQMPGADFKSLGADYPGASFSHPRFSRPANEPQTWVTTIVDDKTCAAFPRAGGRSLNLGEANECLLIRNPQGFLLLAKTRAPGGVRGNDISPGKLRLRQLDAQLGGDSPWTEPFDKPIFEFDADHIGGQVVIAATIKEGLLLATGNATGSKFAAKELAAPDDLTSLTMTARGRNAFFGFLRPAANGASRVVLAELPPPPAP